MSDIDFIKVEDERLTEEVAFLAQEIWREHYIPIIGEEQVDYMLEWSQSAQAVADQIRQGTAYYIISEDGSFIGYVAVTPREEDLFLSKLYLLSRTRGRGYGRKALDFVQGIAEDMDYDAITLRVHKRNPSVEVYKSLGFFIEEDVVTDIGSGFLMDDYQMKKRLK